MGTTDTIKRIEKELGMSETSQVSTFEGIRERTDGSMQEVTVEVLDAGKGAGARHYAVNLRFEDGRDDIVGNPAATLDEALSNVSAHLG
jgi:hypothetical protein